MLTTDHDPLGLVAPTLLGESDWKLSERCTSRAPVHTLTCTAGKEALKVLPIFILEELCYLIAKYNFY